MPRFRPRFQLPPLPASVASWLMFAENVVAPPSGMGPPPLSPAPALTVTELFASLALVTAASASCAVPTPALAMFNVVEPPSETRPPPFKPVPAFTVTELFCNSAFVMLFVAMALASTKPSKFALQT